MSKEGIVYLLMIFNSNRYVNAVLQRSLRANEGHIGVNERISTVIKKYLDANEWNDFGTCSVKNVTETPAVHAY